MNIRAPLIALSLFVASTPLLPAADWDDTVLVQQILAAVDKYRIVMKDFEGLEQSLEAQKGGKTDSYDNPKVKAYIENSVNPAESEMRRFFDQYRDEHGTPALLKLAKKYAIKELVKP